MKKRYILLALFVFPALGHFLGFYLDGRGVLGGHGFFVSALSMFILPIPLAILIAWSIGTGWKQRALLVVPFILLQLPFFWLFPAGATSEMIGVAHKLKREFSTTALRAAADDIRSKHFSGTLQSHFILEDDRRNFGYASILVDKSELPKDLQDKFDFVAIAEPNDSTSVEVRFAFGPRRGIACNATPRETGFFRYSMADGVHAYRYQRL